MSAIAAMNNRVRHSADVRMHLLLNGLALTISQLGPDFLVLEHSAEHPAGTAEILLKVDNYETRWTVRLPNGLRNGQRQVSIALP
jgi:hypothetical protein